MATPVPPPQVEAVATVIETPKPVEADPIIVDWLRHYLSSTRFPISTAFPDILRNGTDDGDDPADLEPRLRAAAQSIGVVIMFPGGVETWNGPDTPSI